MTYIKTKIHRSLVPIFCYLILLTAIPLSAAEMVIFDWNGPVTESKRGFPYNLPPIQNGNWVTPINYAEGSFYIRIEIRSQPVLKTMNLQFCVWQEKNGDNYALESCTALYTIGWNSTTIITTSQSIGSMWKKGGNPIEWDRARFRNGIAIKNIEGLPVSDYNGWNWNGEDPKAWYPLNLRYTVVVVSKNSTFSGWGNYITSSPQSPFGDSPHAIPGKIEAENYDLGGSGVAYSDTTSGNSGGVYRAGGVDLCADTQASKGYAVCNSALGEWLEYTANITAGTYDIMLTYASNASTQGGLELQIGDSPNGTNLKTIGTFADIINTGGSSNYTTTQISNANLTGGNKVIRLQCVNGAGFYIDSVSFVSVAPTSTPLLHIDRAALPRVYWDYNSSVAYQLEKSTNLSSWALDERPLTQEDNTLSFQMTEADLLENTFFQVRANNK
jgi:hypothetical protein